MEGMEGVEDGEKHGAQRTPCPGDDSQEKCGLILNFCAISSVSSFIASLRISLQDSLP